MTKEERQVVLHALEHLKEVSLALHSLSDMDLKEQSDKLEAAEKALNDAEGPTLDDVRAKVGEAIMALSPEVVQGVFVNYKVAKVSQFRPEQYGNLIETLDEMIKEASNANPAA